MTNVDIEREVTAYLSRVFSEGMHIAREREVLIDRFGYTIADQILDRAAEKIFG